MCSLPRSRSRPPLSPYLYMWLVTGLAWSLGSVEVVLPLPPAEQMPPLAHDTTYGYQKRNVRNFVLFLHAQLAGRRDWMDWCSPISARPSVHSITVRCIAVVAPRI